MDWLTSTTAMELTEVPESLVVIGGGYVGMEQAQLFAHLGARVTLVGRLAPAAEPEVADTGAVLGVHATAETAGEIMLAATYAIKARMTVDDIAGTWAPCLTMAESLRIAAGLFRNEMPTTCCA